MQLTAMTDTRVLQDGGALASAEYTIDQDRIAHLMWVMRTGLYSRKALAVLREYSSNGWDAQRSIGIMDMPLDIEVPTHGNPVFVCRDHGPGLSQHDTLHVFTGYGTTTKEDDPDQVGTLGLGSKSAYCVADSFTVTSWYDGTKSVYNSALDDSNKGRMTLFHQEPCGEETGVEIRVSVPAEMVDEFQREARDLFCHMRPKPNLNISVKDPPPGMTNGYILDVNARYVKTRWMGIMGCVPYKIDIEQIKEMLMDAGILDALQQVSGGIYIPIGKVDFAASREELQYTSDSEVDVLVTGDDGVQVSATHIRKGTKTVLVEHFKALLDEYFETLMAALSDETLSGWDRRTKALFLHKWLHFPLPKRFSKLAKEAVNLWDKETPLRKPTTFHMVNKSVGSTAIPVNTNTRILIKDPSDTRTLKGWNLEQYDVMVVPNKGTTRKAIREQVEQYVKDADCVGVTIDDLENHCWWSAPSTSGGRSGRVANAKHRQSTFLLTDTDTSTRALSNNWERAEPPTSDHIYFIINAFRVRGSDGFYSTINKDRALAHQFDLPYPEKLYGYKTTQKSPIDHKDIEHGVYYYAWRKQFFGDLMTAKRKGQLRDIAWAQAFSGVSYLYGCTTYDSKKRMRVPDKRNFEAYLPGLIERLTVEFGRAHLVTRLFAKPVECRASTRGISHQDRKTLFNLKSLAPGRVKRSAEQCALDRVLVTYPMLRLSVASMSDLTVFVDHETVLFDYIRSTDKARN